MESSFTTFQKFIQSQECIFSFKLLDYPTPLQQKMLISYFQYREMIKKQHNDIVRFLHSASQRQLQSIILGMIYMIILNQKSIDIIFESYMSILRNQAWSMMGKLFTQIIKQTFLFIKPSNRINLSAILGRLYYFGQLSLETLTISIKSMDCFDLSEDSLNYCNSYLLLFNSITHNDQPVDGSGTIMLALCSKLFFKLLKAITVINLLQDQNVKEYKQKCIQIVNALFSYDIDRCLSVGMEILKPMRQLDRERDLQFMIQQSQLYFTKNNITKITANQVKQNISLVLPIRIETVLIFLLNQNASKVEVNLELNWAFNSVQEHYHLIIIDVLKYILFTPKEEFKLEQMMYILEWLLYKCCSNNILFQIWKGELFSSWFMPQNCIGNQIQIDLYFLAYMFSANFEFGENLLIYLLRNRSNKAISENMSNRAFSQILKDILTKGEEAGIIKVQQILKHPRLSPRTRDEMLDLFAGPRQKLKQQSKANMQLYYDPLQSLNQQKKESLEFSDGSQNDEPMENHYMDEQVGQNILNVIPQQVNMEIQDPFFQGEVYKVNLQKQFVEDLQPQLQELLSSPNLLSYRQTIAKLLNILKAFKVDNETELIQVFISQIAKLTYLLFNTEFEQYSIQPSKDESVIIYLLASINSDWKRANFTNQCLKKIVKKTVQLFPNCQPAYWKLFFLFFKRGTTANIKQFKDWLISKDKNELVVPLLKELMRGNLKKQLIDNASLLGYMF